MADILDRIAAYKRREVAEAKARVPLPTLAAAAAAAPSPRGFVRALKAKHAEGRTALIAAYSLWIEAARRPALQAVEEGWTEAYRDAVETLLRAGGSAQPRLDARLVVAALDGLLLEQLSRPEGEPDDELPAVVRRLLQALLPAR